MSKRRNLLPLLVSLVLFVFFMAFVLPDTSQGVVLGQISVIPTPTNTPEQIVYTLNGEGDCSGIGGAWNASTSTCRVTDLHLFYVTLIIGPSVTLETLGVTSGSSYIIEIGTNSTLNNSGTIDNSNGTIINNGTLNNNGTIDNTNGSIDNSAGVINNYCDATIIGEPVIGNPVNQVNDNCDDIPPVITPSVSGALGNNNWYVSAVTVSFTCADEAGGSDLATNTVAGTTLTSDGADQSVTNTGECIDNAGNVALPVTVSDIDIDTTSPILTINIPQVYDVQPLGTALDFSAIDTVSGLDGDPLATLTTTGGATTAKSGDQPPVGVYTIVVMATDLAGNTATSEERVLVIYDPSGGFVTGGGWIDSPAGAYKPDLTLSGKATFGFVAKHQKGASTPMGNTTFQFKAGELNFYADSYEWLVVNQGGTNAQFKGAGTINGAGSYRFMLWGGDDSPDTFRIKIWQEAADSTETVIYDNDFNQPIGGGSIVIHKRQGK